jgi:hypothetical protein
VGVGLEMNKKKTEYSYLASTTYDKSQHNLIGPSEKWQGSKTVQPIQH